MTSSAARAPDRPSPPPPLNVTSLSFWGQTADEREDTFRLLRADAPVSWQPPMEGALMPPQQEGLWVVTRHEHVLEASRRPEVYCSSQGWQFEEVPEDILEAASSIIGMDNPRHQKLRRLVSSAFTPRQVTRLIEQIQHQARQVVDRLLDAKCGDFVDLVAKPLPMWTVNELMGLDDNLREEATALADGMVSYNDPAVAAGREAGQVLNDSLVGLLTLGLDLAAHRRRHPAADLMTNLVQAEVDGQKLTDEEIASFFVLLTVAGNDTSRNATSHAVRALQDHPDQRRTLTQDFPGRIDAAVEEILRWSSPVMTVRRTATRDTTLGGQHIRAGDWVALMYPSANRDERVFTHPERFDLTRTPNPHVSFGGGGPHYCLGAFIARAQLRAILNELLHRAPTLEVDTPEYLVSNFVHGIKHMPCHIT
ncbi:cytochrome P450 [Streptomyces hyderabadensis]|uniref:Cytochrome P450 n=1 Tax=Streptomyces hyderabadensis TaxID=598549 RepID=A0ABP9IW25_9ACTN|nr:cytochrome P450 [Streptomyces hyderabadensis]